MSQLTFQEYFERQFAADLAAFTEAMPASQRKHFMKSPESYSIAMNYLVDPRPALRTIPLERRPLFAASLYFTSLMDQAMYYHHFESYERYRRLTDYPKLTGACPGACMYMAEPSMALERTNLFDVDPADYIQSRADALARNRFTLAPILREGTKYFRHAFPAFLRRHLPDISDPEALYRRVFDDWSEVPNNPVLQAEPKVEPKSFYIAAGWGPAVEVRPAQVGVAVATLTLEDEFGACLELDFDEITGSFAGLRLQRYHKVEHHHRPRGMPRSPGLPCIRQPGRSAKLTLGPIVCSKRMTAVGQGDLFVDWSRGKSYDQASSFPMGDRGGVLHFYYFKGELAAFCLEGVHITIFNEMPLFERDGR